MGFVKFMRTPDSYRIISKKSEWSMLGYIALHMRFEDDRFGDLQKGECFMSAESVGLTQREYRTAKKNLADWNLATFRTTNRNTIAKLVDSSIFDVGNQKTDKQTDKQNPKKETKPEKFDFKSEMIKYGFDEKLTIEWIDIRKKKSAVNTESAFKGFVREVEKSKLDKNEILKKCVEKSWRGFEAKWIEEEKITSKGTEGMLGPEKYREATLKLKEESEKRKQGTLNL
jgi:hypothetical protein